ncbi:hypothetical protein Tco_0951886 [Tanacetum coccineum]|uniref:Uncharacterized protein n=1 Tax=Tanacetum coccineum TaxID=301880 RepID=A0ABQ5DY73_9ASTR
MITSMQKEFSRTQGSKIQDVTRCEAISGQQITWTQKHVAAQTDTEEQQNQQADKSDCSQQALNSKLNHLLYPNLDRIP